MSQKALWPILILRYNNDYVSQVMVLFLIFRLRFSVKRSSLHVLNVLPI